MAAGKGVRVKCDERFNEGAWIFKEFFEEPCNNGCGPEREPEQGNVFAFARFEDEKGGHDEEDDDEAAGVADPDEEVVEKRDAKADDKVKDFFVVDKCDEKSCEDKRETGDVARDIHEVFCEKLV